jgi:hypothetical protein
MRYFRRGGPDVLIFESESRQRFVRGPQQPTEENPDGVPGETVAYEEDEELGDRMIEQLSHDPYWYEVDGRGDPVVVEDEADDEAEAETEGEAPPAEEAEAPAADAPAETTEETA